MVLEMPGPDKHCLFVASSLDDQDKAESEIAAWARLYGYHLSDDQIFTLFGGNTEAREWHLAERLTA